MLSAANYPITYLMTTPKLNATCHRWASQVANNNFEIKHIPAKVTVGADALSRLPVMITEFTESMSINEVKACLGRRTHRWISDVSGKRPSNWQINKCDEN